MPGMRPHSRSAKNTCRSARDSVVSSDSADSCAFELQALVERKLRWLPAWLRMTRFCVVRPLRATRVPCQTRSRSRASVNGGGCGPRSRGAGPGTFRQQTPGECDAAFDDIVADDFVDQPQFARPRAIDRCAAQQHIERVFHADEPRQSSAYRPRPAVCPV